MTTSIKERRTVGGDLSSFHSDCYLEQFFIRLSKRVMGNTHESQVLDRGAELNATVGSTTGLEANVRQTVVDRVREHRARLKRPRVIVLMMRAAIRKSIIPAIRRQLEERRRQQQREQAQKPIQEDNCSAEPMPRIPTRAEEQQVEKRACNPDLSKTQDIATIRAIEAAQWRLRIGNGGRYDVPIVLKNFPGISYFRRDQDDLKDAVKRNAARALGDLSYDTKSLEWYLAHAEFVGALVRTPTEEENREGWPLSLDEEAVKRLFKVLYACRNPRAIDRWTSLPLPERYAALRDTSYEELERKVARCVFPLTMRFMPKWALMVQHLLRAQHRLRTWYNADLRSPPDVPLVGHVMLMAPPSGTMDEGGIEKLEAPTEATIAARCEQGWSVMRVEPNVAPVNTTLAEYFGPVLPPEVLLRGTKARAPRSAERARIGREKRAPLLAEALARMKPQSPHEPTKPHMVAFAVALKVFEGGTARDLATLRESMNSAQNARAVFVELVLSRGESGFPWREMGAPEKNECGGSFGSDSDSDYNAVENEAVEDDEEEAAVDCEAAEDAADEEGEDLALGALFDSVVTAVGAEAEDLVVEIDDAASDADALAVAEARIEAGLGLEQRAP